MGLKNMKGKKAEGKVMSDYEAPNAGSQIARLVEIYDLGEHTREFKGEELPNRDMIVLVYSLMGDLKEDGTEKKISTGFTFPLVVSFDWETGELHPKSKLYKHVNALLQGAVFDGDIVGLLGEAATLTIVEKTSKQDSSKKFSVISDVGAVPNIEGFKVPDTTSELISFDTSTATQSEFEELPDFIKDKIKEAVNFDDMFSGVIVVEEEEKTPEANEEEPPF